MKRHSLMSNLAQSYGLVRHSDPSVGILITNRAESPVLSVAKLLVGSIHEGPLGVQPCKFYSCCE